MGSTTEVADWKPGLGGRADEIALALRDQVELGDFVANVALADLLAEFGVERDMEFGLRVAAVRRGTPRGTFYGGWGWGGDVFGPDCGPPWKFFFGLHNLDRLYEVPRDWANAYRRLGLVARNARYELP